MSYNEGPERLSDRECWCCYGSFLGGNPLRFSPDPECSTDVERANHKVACNVYQATGAPLDSDHYWIKTHDGRLIHVGRSRFGLGTTTCDVCDP